MDDSVRAELQAKINAEIPADQQFKVIFYKVSAEKDEDPGDLGRAMIIHAMHRLELQTMRRMIEDSRLSKDFCLAKRNSGYVPVRVVLQVCDTELLCARCRCENHKTVSASI